MRLLICALLILNISIAYSQILHIPDNYPTIQAGINAASDKDTVVVAEGRYFENIRFMGKAITLASKFILDNDSTHIRNTIIDGSRPIDPDSAAVVMFVNGEDTTSIINGFTITGGSGVRLTSLMPDDIIAGGGIYSWNASCKVINNIIEENHLTSITHSGGSGIYCAANVEGFWAVIDNNKISNNSSTGVNFSAFGGGIASLINVKITRNKVNNNICVSNKGRAIGGGMEIENPLFGDGVAIIKDNIISNNKLKGPEYSSGGGLYLVRYKEHSEIINNHFSSNTIESEEMARGGGIFMASIENCQLFSNRIINNSVSTCLKSRGGGIYFTNSNNIELGENHFNRNSADYGGAIYTDGQNDISIFNNLISENQAYMDGPAIWIQSSSEIVNFKAQAWIRNNTISNNKIRAREGSESTIQEKPQSFDPDYQYEFRQITEKHGLPSNSINDITQDSEGFIWIATNTGFSRYDGYNFKNFDLQDKGSSETSQICYKIIEGGGEDLWIASIQGLKRFSKYTESFKEILTSNLSKGHQLDEPSFTLIQGQGGHLWIGTTSGLIRLDLINHDCKTYHINPDNPDDPVNSVYSIMEPSSEELWIGSGNGVFCLDKKRETINRLEIPANELLKGEGLKITSIVKGPNNIWTGSDWGLYKFDLEGKFIKHYLPYQQTINTKPTDVYRPRSSFITSLSINALLVADINNNPTLFTANNFSLNILDINKDEFIEIFENPKYQNSISTSFLRSLFFDNSGRLWIELRYSSTIQNLFIRLI